MHIPDAYLSPSTEAAAYAVMVPIWSIAARKTSKTLSTKQAPLLSIGAAFCFAIQMFNIPAVGGTTAHALGSTLLAILVGPWAALLGMTLSLAIQALLFGDGGILSLGANCWDMGLVACFVGYGSYRLFAGRAPLGSPRSIIAAGLGGYAGTVTASFSAGLLLGIQPLVAHDATGHALYCPYGLNVAVPAMVMSHLLMAGPAEAIITVGAVAYLWRVYPEYADPATRIQVGSSFRVAKKLVWLIILTPIGLIAGGDAWGEWDLSELIKRVGYAPAGFAKTHEIVHPLMPDYGFGGLTGTTWQFIGYIASAAIGCTAVAIFTRSVLRAQKPVVVADRKPGKPSTTLPAWLNTPSPSTSAPTLKKSKWLEKTLYRLRATVERTVAAEIVAHAPGLLQSVDPLAKAVGFLCALVAVALARSPLPLAGLFAVSVALAVASAIDLKSLLIRVADLVLFFGAVVALPMSLKDVTAGPTAFRVAGVALSTTGIHSAMVILLRIAAGISLAMVWNLSTKWYELLRSLRSLGVPPLFLSTATLTYRYLFVIVETMCEMVEARTARQVGAPSQKQGRSYVGQGAAILFAKSQAFTEEMHQAMLSRGFDGVPRVQKTNRWKVQDSAFVCAGCVTLLTVLLGHSI